MMRALRLTSIFLLASALGCGDDDTGPVDMGGADAEADASVDTGVDTGAPDTGAPDTGVADTGVEPCGDACRAESVEVGANFACLLQQNGEVYCWGGNLFGQLGDDRMSHMTCGMAGTDRLDCSAVPVQVAVGEAAALSVGSLGSCAALRNGPALGDLFCWGLTDLPDVATDQRDRVFRPAMLDDFADHVQFAKGRQSSCGIVGGEVLCAGENDSGQIGDGTTEMDRRESVAVTDINDASAVALSRSGDFACAITASGVLCWGDNRSGQLGDGVDTHQSCGLGVDIHDCSPTPVSVVLEGDASQIALGRNHACALVGTDVYCWGNNGAGQIGTGEFSATVATPTQVSGIEASAIAAAAETTCALLTDGSIRCWGANEEGQLGDGLDVGAHEVCVVGSRSVDCVATPVTVASEETFSAIALGGDTACAISDGEVYCWGDNEQTQLGTNGPDNRRRSTTPVLLAR